ncbi:MAG: fused MFS/spermidine synthase [Bryobacteraceae bacterium]|jgi:spermidine synthase
MNVFFLCFFLSGFCSLVYQVIWLRVAMAGFGVTTPLVSIVLSVFMAGLALGSWAGGRLVHRCDTKPAAFFIRLYGALELTIGVSGVVVAPLLRHGHALLGVQQSSWGSSSFYLASAAWIALVMLPFCAVMGATFPVAMAGIRAAYEGESARSFSYLYVANVLGAMTGTIGSAFVMIEAMGFSRSLLVAAVSNALIATLAFALSRTAGSRRSSVPRAAAAASTGPATDTAILPLLATTGLASLAMEVVWTRQYLPFLGPVVYSFAAMLAIYLAATAIGSRLYRRRSKPGGGPAAELAWRPLAVLASGFALLPLLTADPRVPSPEDPDLLLGALRVAVGIGPFCGVLGFLTPMLVDRWSGGDPDRAGRAYAVNAIGCILGPLVAGFVLLPALGERWTLILLALPLFAFGVFSARDLKLARLQLPMAALAAGILLIVFTRDFETLYPRAWIRRDYTATVIADGEGMDKILLTNGTGMTLLTPITKMMAHLPLTSLDASPRRALVLCFGMGTSFRSALSWGIPVTVVELVPSVPKVFGFFHANGEQLLRSPRATVVIDDDRRYLERTRETYDVIVVDPPPPVAAAGSSLLYSTEFYRVLARRLSPGGILQQWLPGADFTTGSAFAQALRGSFPYVRTFRSIEGWGFHFLCSFKPLPRPSAAEMASRLPPAALKDLLEWGPKSTAEAQFRGVLDQELPLQQLIDREPGAPTLTDDRPVNEYYLLRQALHGAQYLPDATPQ